MRAPGVAALVLVLASCGEPATQPVAAAAVAAFARGDNPRAPLAVYTTQLRAENEEPDPSGSQAWGFAQVKVKPGGVIEWTVRVHNPAGEEFRAGHIHVITSPDDTGPVAQGILSSANTDRKFEVSGTATNPALANALLADPGNYYVNLHTVAFPGGAIRGELP